MDFGRITPLKQALDVYALRNSIINQNIANVDTPNYKRQYVSFEEYLNNSSLKLEGKLTNEKHIPIFKSSPGDVRVQRDMNNSTRNDKNNVNADVEATKQVENTVLYNAMIQRISSRFRTLRLAATDGGK